jgi:hypothetical protein
VLVKNPLGCSYDEHIDSATCQSQNLSLANCYFACHSTFTADSGEAGARIRNRENGKTKWFLSGLLANRRCLECRLTAVVMGSVSAVSEARIGKVRRQEFALNLHGTRTPAFVRSRWWAEPVH